MSSALSLLPNGTPPRTLQMVAPGHPPLPPPYQGGERDAGPSSGPRTKDQGPRTKGQRTRRAKARRGITLTEVLIAIMILGIGLVSLAALFPIGLTRLRDAARYTRSAYLTEAGSTDVSARGLLIKKSFAIADYFNSGYYPFWYTTPAYGTPAAYDPFTQDTPFYGGNTVDPTTGNVLGANTVYATTDANGNPRPVNTGTGLPIAYDPLWRYWAVDPTSPNGAQGVYLDPLNAAGRNIPEARFAAGTDGNATFIAADPTDGGPPSAWGLQRLTNFNRPTATNAVGATVPLFPASNALPSIFVSPEDLVLQDPSGTNYTLDGVSRANGGTPVINPSPVVPDLNTSGGTFTNDWRYSWIFTGFQTNVPPGGSNFSLGATFDGNIVIFESRPFGISLVQSPLGPMTYQVTGETVVEAVWGYSTNVATLPGFSQGYGSGADRTVLLRWPANMPDPVIKGGDWIADVTYERNWQTVESRFLNWPQAGGGNGGLQNAINSGEWDNFPAQRCYWYQVQRATPPTAATGPFVFNNDPTAYRYSVVYVTSTVVCRTVLNTNGQPVHRDAALICPYVINVIPQTFTTIAVQ